jgi:hypothetical protein
LAFLLYPGGFTTPPSEVIEFRTSDASSSYDFHTSHSRRLKRENTLDSNTTRNLSNGERFIEPSTLTTNAYTFEYLNAFFGTLTH